MKYNDNNLMSEETANILLKRFDKMANSTPFCEDIVSKSFNTIINIQTNWAKLQLANATYMQNKSTFLTRWYWKKSVVKWAGII